ncbi:MAG: lamin tail domain-containing protein [Rhodobacteraceae bacterium]|nr:lamin tail domain-containing protein [Paracoccaceae bacterium]
MEKNNWIRGILKDLLAVSAWMSMATSASAVWINEIHYDNTGGDLYEFIEVAGLAGENLSGWSIVLYNGAGGAVYSSIPLSGAIANQSNGFGTLGILTPGLQNGSELPPGIRTTG